MKEVDCSESMWILYALSHAMLLYRLVHLDSMFLLAFFIVHLLLYIYIHIYICMYVYIYIYTYTHMLGIFAYICARGLKKSQQIEGPMCRAAKFDRRPIIPEITRPFKSFNGLGPSCLWFLKSCGIFLMWSKPKERCEQKNSCQLPVIEKRITS